MAEVNASNASIPIKLPIYRFKFSKDMMSHLTEFSLVHKYDDKHLFKEAWDRWIIRNEQLIERENQQLVLNGYVGKIEEKMLKTVRYLKKKPLKKTKVKKRCKYSGVHAKLINDIDRHICNIAIPEKLKPAFAYNNFISNPAYNKKIEFEVSRIIYTGVERIVIEKKITKTYKNRYYLQQKKHSRVVDVSLLSRKLDEANKCELLNGGHEGNKKNE